MEVEWKEKHQQLKIEEQKGENDPMSKMRQFSKSVVHSSEKKSRQDTKERSNSKLQKGATMKQNRKSTERYQDPEYSQRAQQKGEEWNQKNKSSKSHLINKEEARNNRFQKDKNYMMRENQKTQFYNLSDLIYNIFCCLKCPSNDKSSGFLRNKDFQKDLARFEEQRDLVNIVSQMSMLQYKMHNAEMKLNGDGISDLAEPSTAKIYNLHQTPSHSVLNPAAEKGDKGSHRVDTKSSIQRKMTRKKSQHERTSNSKSGHYGKIERAQAHKVKRSASHRKKNEGAKDSHRNKVSK